MNNDQANNINAALIIIGNEILSGRTQDKNLNYIATSLVELGINLVEVRVIKDIEIDIIEAVRALSEKYNYVFTSGGIGPTHDDITTQSIAKAFNLPVIRDKKAESLLRNHYQEKDLNQARLKMADIPKGALLLNNPVSSAPGFKINNVFVMAGVPNIMQAMFNAAKEYLHGGKKTIAKSISVFVTEGDIAEDLTKIQNNYPQIEIGSYPFIKNKELGTSLVFRATDKNTLDNAINDIKKYLRKLNIEIIQEI
jgi:molybdenum cofactor synthesis domain-containing protein